MRKKWNSLLTFTITIIYPNHKSVNKKTLVILIEINGCFLCIFHIAFKNNVKLLCKIYISRLAIRSFIQYIPGALPERNLAAFTAPTANISLLAA